MNNPIAAQSVYMPCPFCSKQPERACDGYVCCFEPGCVLHCLVMAEEAWNIRAQPATAKVVLPVRKRPDPYCYDQGGNANVAGWNACLDEVERLNNEQ